MLDRLRWHAHRTTQVREQLGMSRREYWGWIAVAAAFPSAVLIALTFAVLALLS